MFALAERQGQTIIEGYPDTELASVIEGLADYVILLMGNRKLLRPARPLDDGALNDLAFGRTSTMHSETIEPESQALPNKIKGIPHQPPRYLSQSVLKKDIIHGCAFAGAVVTTAQLRDAVTVMHGPRSCAHLASYCLDSCTLHSVSRRRGWNP